VRGVLMAVNFQAAAERALADELYGPAVTASYTSAFHALHGFLALHGRVFLDMLWRPGDSHVTTGVLTRHNEWIFERRPFAAHRGRWCELQQIFIGREEDAPACFHELFDFLFRGRHQSGIPLIEIIKNPNRYRLRMPDRFEDFLGQISEARHAAIYAAAGEDPYVVEALVNRDTFSSLGIDGHARAFVAFAEGLLRTTTDEILARFGEIKASPGVRTLFSLGVRMPWFDEPKLTLLASADLQAALAIVDHWLDDASEDEWAAWLHES
jgi:hypothetical protein